MGICSETIVGIRAHSVRDKAAHFPASGCLLELETGQGLVGTGIGIHGIAESAVNLAERFLVGQDHRNIIALWSTVSEHLRVSESRDLDIRAAAALDMALWDLKARSGGMPLWKSLGGSRPKTFACLNATALDADHERFQYGVFAAARNYAFRAGKLQLSLASDSDLRCLEILHSGLLQNTPNPDLLISTGEWWPAEQAISGIAAFEQKFDLVCIQDSNSTWSAAELKQLSGQVVAGICLGAKRADARGLFTSLDHNDFDILTIDPAISGITGSLQIAEAAYGFELPVILAAGPGNMGAHLASVMPTIMYLEVDCPQPVAGPVHTGVSIEDGWAVAGDEPGHAISVESGALE